MFTRRRRVRQLELCNRDMFGDLILTCQSSPFPIISQVPYHVRPPEKVQQNVQLKVHDVKEVRAFINDSDMDKSPRSFAEENEKRRASILVDQLLMDIYTSINNPTDYNSTTSSRSQKSLQIEASNLVDKDVDELLSLTGCLEDHVVRIGGSLVRQLKRRDALRRQRDAHCDVITNHLCKRAPENTDMRFTIQPAPGESGFSQWVSAMKMVSQLPGGIPPEFRRRLWLTLAEKHLASKNVDWERVERNCFSEWSHPADAELGVQIVKDLHRTGCSLFCGEDGQENQALLKKVLLAYARWNKAVGYCQGFNMLAALILQVTDKDESDALKVMIYLIEGVLPESYFADSLRGLSVDMAVFRELLRSKLPHLSRHLDALQAAAKEGTTSYEPPLTNVFTMQWFLTLFCNCLPQPTVLRVWDLIFLEGNEMLLRTALAIWQALADRILSVKSADEFYCIMGVLTRELLEFGLIDANSLVKAVVTIGPLTELKSLREHYLYNINPWGSSLSSISESEKQLKLYPRERLVLDISALKKQYAKLKQRQRQAHIIFNAAVTRQPPRAAPVAMNHLLLGKSALVPAKRIGPPKGSIPPARQPPSTLHWKDTPQSAASSSSSSDTELCDEPGEASSEEEECSKNSQFEIDNPTATGDNTNLMTEDNTIRENYSATVDQSATLVTDSSNLISNVPLDDDFDTNRINVIGTTVEAAKISDSSVVGSTNMYEFDSMEQTENAIEFEDDAGFDFEKFLEERVHCLKPTKISPDEDDVENELKRVEFGRRNSQRALQIMQENSLILHRILQCQPRLSPSPPTVQNESPTCSIDVISIPNFTLEKSNDTDMVIPEDSSLTNSLSDYWQTKDENQKDYVQSLLDKHHINYPSNFDHSKNESTSKTNLKSDEPIKNYRFIKHSENTSSPTKHEITFDSSPDKSDEASEIQVNRNKESDSLIKFDVDEDFHFSTNKTNSNNDDSNEKKLVVDKSDTDIYKFTFDVLETDTKLIDVNSSTSKETYSIDTCNFDFCSLITNEISSNTKDQEESSLSKFDTLGTFEYDFDPENPNDNEFQIQETVFKNTESFSKEEITTTDSLSLLSLKSENDYDPLESKIIEEVSYKFDLSHPNQFDFSSYRNVDQYQNVSIHDETDVQIVDNSTDSFNKDLVTNDDITDGSDDSIQSTSRYSSILEYSKNLDEKYNNLILKGNTIGNIKIKSDLSPSTSTSDDPQKEESPEKSPIFNPFPVKISTRQNKDVAVRLGLYKK